MKRFKMFLSLFLILAIVFITGCSTEDEKKNYSFGGSTTLEPIITTAIESFNPESQDIKISYDAQGSSVGIRAYKMVFIL